MRKTMIRSMTAFTRKSAQGTWGSASIEIRSVNHRFLEMSMRLPDSWRNLEMKLREAIRGKLKRGKVDFTVKFEPGSALASDIKVNMPLARQLILAAQNLQDEIAAPANFSANDILKWPMVVQVAESDVSDVQENILSLANEALDSLVAMREREGEQLKTVMLEKLKQLDEDVQAHVPLIPQIIDDQKQKINEKISELDIKVNEERIEQELVLLAQRIDVTEELDRLNVHIKEIEKILNKGGSVGRRLDFLMQELNREANTFGSKSIAVKSSHASIDLKVLIEQMREQVQNIE